MGETISNYSSNKGTTIQNISVAQNKEPGDQCSYHGNANQNHNGESLYS